MYICLISSNLYNKSNVLENKVFPRPDIIPEIYRYCEKRKIIILLEGHTGRETERLSIPYSVMIKVFPHCSIICHTVLLY